MTTKRLLAGGPLAAVVAWLAREVMHVHHWAAPQTLLYCVAPVMVLGGAWLWWRRP